MPPSTHVRVQGARLRSTGESPPASGSPYCLHFQRGACRYGSECAFLHDALPAAAASPELAACQRAYRDAISHLKELRISSVASREEIAAAAATLRDLQPELRKLTGAASSRLAVPRAFLLALHAVILAGLRPQAPSHRLRHTVSSHPSRATGRQRRPKNGARAGAFRHFLLRTFGEEILRSGSGVLDVAGGQGVVAFELLNIHSIPVTIIDPRPTLRLRRLERQWEHCKARSSVSSSRSASHDAAKPHTDGGEDQQARTSPSIPPADAGSVAHQIHPPPPTTSTTARAAAHEPRPSTPRHWSIYWRDALWQPLVHANMCADDATNCADDATKQAQQQADQQALHPVDQPGAPKAAASARQRAPTTARAVAGGP